ncbi:MAG TPA: hypothetical protein VHB48_20650 [Chitinophagaceae bacterium]|jgi:hypothetical protein|nr:hypothetical protein [Chitinophagaceae bacterium]
MKRILQGWHFVRLLRLVLGIMIVWQAAETHDWAIAAIGMLLAGMAVINVGCCSVNTGCRQPRQINQKALDGDVVFEEVKGD